LRGRWDAEDRRSARDPDDTPRVMQRAQKVFPKNLRALCVFAYSALTDPSGTLPATIRPGVGPPTGKVRTRHFLWSWRAIETRPTPLEPSNKLKKPRVSTAP